MENVFEEILANSLLIFMHEWPIAYLKVTLTFNKNSEKVWIKLAFLL